MIEGVGVEQKDGVSIINVQGRIDASNSGQIHEKIMEEVEKGQNNIIVNFSQVAYISSAGLRILIYASKVIDKKSGSFCLCSVNSNIEKIFQISGLIGLFHIHKDVSSSLDVIKS